MAWKAKLIDDVRTDGDKVVAVFEYYDDTVLDGQGQPVPLERQAFSFAPNWSNADMQAAVVARGQAFRAAKVRAAALAATFPANTTIINIP